MKISIALSVTVAGLLLLAFIPHSQQAEVLCPFTKKPPQTPTTLPRCVRYQSSSCCNACLDWSTAATVVSVNGTYVANSLLPPGLSFPGIDKFKKETFCSFVAGADKCLEQIEITYCAVMCAPDSDRFLKVSANGKNGTLYVCDEFAQTLYDACKSLQVLGLPSTLGQLIPNPSIFVQAVIGPLAGTATPLDKLDVKVTPSANGTGTCFTSAPSEPVPSPYLCCDQLSGFPNKCFTEFPDTPLIGINRTVAPSCRASPPAMAPASPDTAPPDTPPSTSKAAVPSVSMHLLLLFVVAILSFMGMSG